MRYTIELFIFAFCVPIFISEGFTSRLIGGEVASPGSARYHASLQNLTGNHVCGGALISRRHVLTAAHCVVNAEPQYIKVVVGTTNLDDGGTEYDVSSIKVNENFNSKTRENDIAVLQVYIPFDLKLSAIIKLSDGELREGDIVTLTGFGALQAYGESTRQMYELHLPVFNQETCKYAMRLSRAVTEEMFCTFTQIGQGTCHGDSGGPLVKENQLVGLISWGIPCAIGFPDVHTRIAPYVPWIKDQMKRKLKVNKYPIEPLEEDFSSYFIG